MDPNCNRWIPLATDVSDFLSQVAHGQIALNLAATNMPGPPPNVDVGSIWNAAQAASHAAENATAAAVQARMQLQIGPEMAPSSSFLFPVKTPALGVQRPKRNMHGESGARGGINAPSRRSANYASVAAASAQGDLGQIVVVQISQYQCALINARYIHPRPINAATRASSPTAHVRAPLADSIVSMLAGLSDGSLRANLPEVPLDSPKLCLRRLTPAHYEVSDSHELRVWLGIPIIIDHDGLARDSILPVVKSMAPAAALGAVGGLTVESVGVGAAAAAAGRRREGISKEYDVVLPGSGQASNVPKDYNVVVVARASNGMPSNIPSNGMFSNELEDEERDDEQISRGEQERRQRQQRLQQRHEQLQRQRQQQLQEREAHISQRQQRIGADSTSLLSNRVELVEQGRRVRLGRRSEQR
jgi:hypothetical protein